MQLAAEYPREGAERQDHRGVPAACAGRFVALTIAVEEVLGGVDKESAAADGGRRVLRNAGGELRGLRRRRDPPLPGKAEPSGCQRFYEPGKISAG